MEPEILQKETSNKGMFYVEEDGKTVGEVIYTRTDNGILNLDHTEVAPEMAGKGLAGKLIKHTVEYARENNLKVNPLCGYAAAQFERHEEYREIQVKP